MYKKLLAIAVILIIVVIIGLVFNTYKSAKRFNDLGIGKELNIVIPKDERIDYKKVESDRKDKSTIWFDLWAESERKKLVEYMKKNNLEIQPEIYKINQTTYFEEAIKIFKFKKIE